MNREFTPDVIVNHARASATIADNSSHAPLAARVVVQPSASLFPRAALTLREQQTWFCALLTTPANAELALDERAARRLVSPSKQLTALERVEVYRRGYHARLVECLEDDYPAVLHALGAEDFQALAHGYIAQHPSTGPSLNVFGAHFATFCRTRGTTRSAFLADLARLEWAVVQAIHAPTAHVLTQQDLGAVPADAWAEVSLTSNPSLQILNLEYPANSYYQAFRRDGKASLPGVARETVAVYRTGHSVWRLPLNEAMALLVESLAAGAPLGQALTRVTPLLSHLPETEALPRISAWFRDAVASGLFSGVRVTTAYS